MFYSYYDKVLEACIICTLIGDYQCNTYTHIYCSCNLFPIQVPFLICIMSVWILESPWCGDLGPGMETGSTLLYDLILAQVR